jgi:hypothetical protein
MIKLSSVITITSSNSYLSMSLLYHISMNFSTDLAFLCFHRRKFYGLTSMFRQPFRFLESVSVHQKSAYNVTTTAVNSILTVRNPASNATALTITPLAGGTRPLSAHLMITQIG